MIYGPVLEIFRQQQKLRMYYDFMDIDTVRYNINGEPIMMVSAVRELPMDVQPSSDSGTASNTGAGKTLGPCTADSRASSR